MTQIGYQKELSEGKLNETFTDISIIIPVYNDPNGVKDTLNSLVNQDYPPENFEIIIADNGSTDATLDIINEFCREYPKLIRLVIEDTIQSSYAARNKGVRIAKGSIIAFIDADMSVDRDWLKKINQSLKEHSWDYLGCDVEIYYKSRSVYEIHDKMKGFPIRNYVNKNKFAPTCCLVVRKVLFDELGPFNSKLVSSGDYEFGNRVFGSGYKLYFDQNIIMRHPARSSLRKLLQKSFRIGRGQEQLLRYYPGRYDKFRRTLLTPSNYFLIPPWGLFLSMKENKIWNQLSLADKIKILLITWLSKLANTSGFFYEKYRNKSEDA